LEKAGGFGPSPNAVAPMSQPGVVYMNGPNPNQQPQMMVVHPRYPNQGYPQQMVPIPMAVGPDGQPLQPIKIVIPGVAAAPPPGVPLCLDNQPHDYQENFTVCGILWAVCCFPWGLLCCFAMRETRCIKCYKEI
jgi:hypothetical protein